MPAADPRAPANRLRSLLARVDDDETSDTYGRGGAVERLEGRLVELLGTEAAVLMPTGTMATQVALRIHADARRSRTVAMHPQAHIEVHELKGYQVVHGLTARWLGEHDRLVELADLESVREPLAAVLLELPQRDLGGALPEWDDLVAQTAWATAHGAANHLDGARLWEAQPYYGRPHAEIAALFDTVYVSLYKGLGGIAGAVLAGPEPFVAEAREWRARLGGMLYNAWPLALAAEVGLDEVLPRMPAYWQRAREIAAAVQPVEGVDLVPDPPQTPMFHVHLDVPPAALARAHDEHLASGGARFFRTPGGTTHPGRSRFEYAVTERDMDTEAEPWVDSLRQLTAQAARIASS